MREQNITQKLMEMNESRKPRVFVDADVLFAGSASPSEYGASLVVLRMAEITLVEAIASEQVIVEVERNLEAKLPEALPTFRLLVQRCLKIVSTPSEEEKRPFIQLADKKDVSILAVAVREACPWLVTFNIKHFKPGHPKVSVLQPGEFVQQVRTLLSQLQ